MSLIISSTYGCPEIRRVNSRIERIKRMARIRKEKNLIREIHSIRVIREHIFFLLDAASRHEGLSGKR